MPHSCGEIFPLPPLIKSVANPSLILASSSPRRLDILTQLGLAPHKIITPACDETPLKGELPAALVQRLAQLKARTVHAQYPGTFVLAGDTVVACGRRILPKCGTAEDVQRCLTFLSGRRHRVYGGLCVVAPDGREALQLSQSVVTFKRLTEKEMADYVKTGEGMGKAGGYALQGAAAGFIRFISGSASGIIGLDAYQAAQNLKRLGYEPCA